MVRRALWAAAAGMGLLVVLLTAVSAVAAETSTAAAGPGSDGHACWNEINSAWEQAPTYVHRRITAMFPEITQDSVAQAFEEGPEARVAVVPRPQLPPAQLAEELYREQGRRTVVLYTWQGDAFRADVVTGADLPRGKRTLAGPSRWVAPDDLHVHLEVVSVILQGRVLATAAQRLAETSLYVAPGLPTDLTAQQVRGLARQLAELPEPVRVALLPRDAVEYEGGWCVAG